MSDEVDDFDQQLDDAWESLQDGDLEAARRAGEKLLRADPAAPDALLLLAACARDTGDVAGALEFLDRAVKADPAWSTAQLWRAEILSADPERLREALRAATLAVDNADEEDELFDAVALKAGIELDMDNPGAARKTLAELPPASILARSPPVALEVAHLHLALDEAANARARFETIARKHPDLADAWHGVGLACEAMEDEKGKCDAWVETLRLDTRASDQPDRLTEAEVADEAEAALGELPERARRLLVDVPIIIADLPAVDDVASGLDPRLLGLFLGTPYPDAGSLGGGGNLTQILLFRRNLERVAGDEAALREEIRTTLLHETGHFFGMDEDSLAQIGLA